MKSDVENICQKIYELDDGVTIDLTIDWTNWINNECTKSLMEYVQKRRLQIMTEITELKGDDIRKDFNQLQGGFYELGYIVETLNRFITDFNQHQLKQSDEEKFNNE